ncbi:class I SAM-dependent methyltransferase [Erythrobacter oryzae]|uniref:class I SAM-dependent methyltransferase n=1 Tax=Erythrobacter oryzae TaxID=3019556 RepID=UPI0025557348|nr:class I SAM-dependent methyltransferase [Erythrobacter sp. COR-2]
MAMFDGVAGRIAVRVMERTNAEAEREAVRRLAAGPGAKVLVMGFGPGIGLQHLLEGPVAEVVGVDPSQVMHDAAARRNALALAEGRLRLVKAQAADLPRDAGPFDGAIAVHTLQICRPFAPTAAMLADVLRPGAQLIGITHGWAARKDYGEESLFTDAVAQGLAGAGFAQARHGRADAEGGTAVLLEAVR